MWPTLIPALLAISAMLALWKPCLQKQAVAPVRTC
jgi:hypothetical protein